MKKKLFYSCENFIAFSTDSTVKVTCQKYFSFCCNTFNPTNLQVELITKSVAQPFI